MTMAVDALVRLSSVVQSATFAAQRLLLTCNSQLGYSRRNQKCDWESVRKPLKELQTLYWFLLPHGEQLSATILAWLTDNGTHATVSFGGRINGATAHACCMNFVSHVDHAVSGILAHYDTLAWDDAPPAIVDGEPAHLFDPSDFFADQLEELMQFDRNLAQPALEIEVAGTRGWLERKEPEGPQSTLQVDLAKRTITLNGTSYDVRGLQACRWVKVLSEHPGEWISGPSLKEYDPELDGARSNLLRQYLPTNVAALIESDTGKGSRLKL